jgi:lipopolysaccharide/colanic/teichoic acid biosynthesis glycosyltransferase/glycosyltransferase involved in cell wall biosynthesis
MSLTFLRGQPGFMRVADIETHVVSTPGCELETFATEEKAIAHALPMQRRIAPLADLSALWRLWLLFVKIRPHIVHAHTPKAGLLAMLAAVCARTPVRIYHVHGLPMLTSGPLRRRLLRFTDRVACLAASRVLCVSSSILEVCVAEDLCDRSKILVLLRGSINGVDAEGRFNPRFRERLRHATRLALSIPEDAKVVLFVGRLVLDKGVRELAAAWQLVKHRDPDAHLLIVGPFEAQDPVPAATRAFLETDPDVHLVGLDWDVVPYYAASDVLAFPTYREGLPVVPLEAAAMELAIVGTRVPGCVDAIQDGITGTLVPARDSDALATALRQYLSDPGLANRHGQAGRARVLRDFKPQDLWKALLGVYREELRRPRCAGHAAVPPACDRNDRVYERYIKPILDRVISGVALIVFAPVLLLTSAVVALFLGSPVIFTQQRPGKNGRFFAILKFRTMSLGDGPLATDERRMTRVGMWLRRLSLDELPELFNVLRGDMSLVGPRPLLTQYLDRYTPEQARRHEVKPGITGWAQINGRNTLSWEEKFKYDVWYVDHCSFWLDVRILAATVWKTIRRDGITAPGHVTAHEFMGSAQP